MDWEEFSFGVLAFMYTISGDLLKLSMENLKYNGPGAISINSDMKILWQSAGEIDYYITKKYTNLISYQQKNDKYAYIIVSGYNNVVLYKLKENGNIQYIA